MVIGLKSLSKFKKLLLKKKKKKKKKNTSVVTVEKKKENHTTGTYIVLYETITSQPSATIQH